MRERISDREGAHLTALCTVFVYRLRDTRDTNDSDQTIAASISLLSAGGLSLSLSLSLSQYSITSPTKMAKARGTSRRMYPRRSPGAIAILQSTIETCEEAIMTEALIPGHPGYPPSLGFHGNRPRGAPSLVNAREHPLPRRYRAISIRVRAVRSDCSASGHVIVIHRSIGGNRRSRGASRATSSN